MIGPSGLAYRSVYGGFFDIANAWYNYFNKVWCDYLYETTYKDGGIAFVPRAFFLLWALEYLVVTLYLVYNMKYLSLFKDDTIAVMFRGGLFKHANFIFPHNGVFYKFDPTGYRDYGFIYNYQDYTITTIKYFK